MKIMQAKMLPAIQTTIKTGQEQFTYNNEKLPLNVLSFWKWSSSELLGNALRGVLAEFIIASTIDTVESPREEWDTYDLKTKNGLKIEVKSSSYLQSWRQKNFSKIIFGIQQTGETQSANPERSRKSDIYIFCVLSHKEKIV
jgi:hypothetical protein